MFANYFASPWSTTATNTLVARVLLGVYAIWKLLSYDFERLDEWPLFLFQAHRHRGFLPFPDLLSWLPLENAIAVAALVSFIVGYRTVVSALLAAALITHLGALHYVVTNSGATLLPVVYALVLFAWQGAGDGVSLDALRSLRRRPAAVLRESLVSPAPPRFENWALRWLLVLSATFYFFTGYSKLVNVGPAWADGLNLALMIHRDALMHLDAVPWAGRVLIEWPLLAWTSSVATLVLECGFLLVVLARRGISLFVLGLGGMHLMIWLTMEILFFDQFVLYALFLRWDRIQAWLADDAPREIAFEPGDARRMGLLAMRRRLDVNGRLRFRPEPQPGRTA